MSLALEGRFLTREVLNPPLLIPTFLSITLHHTYKHTFLHGLIRAHMLYCVSSVYMGFPCGSDGKESACNMGDLGFYSVSKFSCMVIKLGSCHLEELRGILSYPCRLWSLKNHFELPPTKRKLAYTNTLYKRFLII